MPNADLSASSQQVQLPEIPSLGLTTLMNRYILSLVRTRLRFIWSNDPAITQQDLCSELQRKAIATAHKAAEQGYSDLHRSHAMRITIKNYCSNIATQRGNRARCPLQRQHQASKVRSAWLVDTTTREIREVEVSLKRKHRKGNYILVRWGQTCQYRHLQRLYTSEAEARVGLERFLTLGDGMRPAILDLTADHDDFCPSLISIDSPVGTTESLTRHDLIDNGKPQVDLGLGFDVITNPRVRQCLDLLLHRVDDPVFTQFCRKFYGEDPSTLGERALLRRAMKFCGTDLQEMRTVLQRFRS
jgi:hypothetical protein